jgi:oxygen-independent coproporphyrinogen-3 oxidase
MTNPRFLPPRAAYIHVPFCRHRCGYCNFTLVAGRDELIPAYLAAIERELSRLGTPQTVDTLYIGGGTPSHLPEPALVQFLEMVRQWLRWGEQYEFTMEANPSDLSGSKASIMRDYGVNRISLGAQSFDDGKLLLLERDHRRTEIEQAVEIARAMAARVALDLIFAVPGETLDIWRDDLDRAIRLGVDHVSTYGLTIERGTRFWSRWKHGTLTRPPDEFELALYEMGIERLSAAGYEHYEVSNFAQPQRHSRHNLAYWTGRTYFGFGPGAARHIQGCRAVNHRSTTTYLRRILAGESAVAEQEQLAAEDAARERLVVGLRLRRGIDERQFAAETGYSPDRLAGPACRQLLDAGLLERAGGHLRLTRRGLALADSVATLLLAT